MKTVLWFSICVLAWGVAVFLMTFVTRGAGKLNVGTILVCNLVGYALMIGLLARDVQFAWSWNHALAALISSLFVAANYSYYKLSHTGEGVTILAPLTGLYVVVTVLLGMVLLHETMTLRKGLGIALAVAAVILLSWESHIDAHRDGESATTTPTKIKHTP